MTGGLDEVRGIMAAVQDVPVPDDLRARAGQGANPDPADDAGPDVGDVPSEAEFAARFGGGAGGDPVPDAGSGGADGVDAALQDRLATAAGFALNDVGNGQRFVLHFGDDVLWVPRVGWHNWTGTHWALDDDTIQVRRLAQRLGPLIADEVPFLTLWPGMWARLGEEERLMAEQAAALADTDDQGRLTGAAEARLKLITADLKDIGEIKVALRKLRGGHLSFAKTTGNAGRMQAAIGEAGLNLACALDDLDAEPLAVNTLSGVLRFSVRVDGDMKYAQVVLEPHDRAQRHTKIMPVVYDRGADCPQFLAFLERIMPDAQVRGFLQRIFGLAMTGLTGDQILCFFYGMGANGKSVLVDLIARVLGDYAATAKIESLTGQGRKGGGEATPDLVPLIGARFVRASEPDEGVKWQEGLIKDLTGGEPIMVRSLHENFVTVRPQFKLIISGNHKPDIRGTDDGIWRRLKLIPFEVQIPVAERIPKDEMDRLLFAEAPGVLNWLIEGLLDYLEGGLREPVAVLEATQEFRDESDPYGMFLNECCVVDGDARHSMKVTELMHAFLFWQAQNGMGAFSDRTVSKKLADKSRRWMSKAGQRFSRRKSVGEWRYDGIRLTDVFALEWEKAPKDQRGRAIVTAGPSSAASQYTGDF